MCGAAVPKGDSNYQSNKPIFGLKPLGVAQQRPIAQQARGHLGPHKASPEVWPQSDICSPKREPSSWRRGIRPGGVYSGIKP
jgi:hypothetical protein